MKKGYFSLLATFLLSNIHIGLQAQIIEYNLQDSTYSSNPVPLSAEVYSGQSKPTLKFTCESAHLPGWGNYYVEVKIASLDSLRNGNISYDTFYQHNAINLRSTIGVPQQLFRTKINFTATKGLFITQSNFTTSRNYIYKSGGNNLFVNTAAQTTLSDLPFLDSIDMMRGNINFNDKIVLSAGKPATGIELMVIDSSYNVTVIDLNSGVPSSRPQEFFNWGNNMLLFSADNGTDGIELWRTDGTQAGTSLIKDINTGGNSTPDQFYLHGGKVYFVADDGTGKELWVTDGTNAGTVKVVDLNTATTTNPGNLLDGPGGLLYFTITDTSGSKHMYKTDGTSAGTTLVSGDVALVLGNNLTVKAFNGAIYFAGYPTSNQIAPALYKTDGTSAGTVEIYKPYTGSSTFYGLSQSFRWDVSGSYLYFTADDSTRGTEVYRTDGTTQGTVILADINDVLSDYPNYITAIPGGGVFFRHRRSAIGTELFVADLGTGVGLPPNDFPYDEPMALYPNPANNWMVVKLPEHEAETTLKIYDLVGRELISQKLGADVKEIKLDVSLLKNGVYLVRTSSKAYTKFVIAR